MSNQLKSLKRLVQESENAAKAFAIAVRMDPVPDDYALIALEAKQKRKLLDLAIEQLVRENDARSESQEVRKGFDDKMVSRNLEV